jgi:hypothetical protein
VKVYRKINPKKLAKIKNKELFTPPLLIENTTLASSQQGNFKV